MANLAQDVVKVVRGTPGFVKSIPSRWKRFRASIIGELLAAQAKWLWILVGIFLVSLTMGLIQLGIMKDIFDRALVDKVIELGPELRKLVFIAFLGLFTGFASKQVGARIGYQLEYDLRNWLYGRLNAADPKALDFIATGQIVTRALTDLYFVEVIIVLLPIIPLFLVTLLLLAGIIFSISPLMAVVALAATPVNIRIMWKVRHKLRAMFWVSLDRRAKVTTTFDEAVRGVRVVKAFSREDRERRRIDDAATSAYSIAVSRTRLSARYGLFTAAIPIVCNAVILLIAGRQVADGSVSVGQMVIVLTLTAAFTELATNIDELIIGWQALRSGQTRIFELLVLPAPPTTGSEPLPEVSSGLVMTDVAKSHGGVTVLDGFDLAVLPGELVVVQGATGSGKSTVAGLAAGLVTPDRGTVSLDGADLTTVDAGATRAAVRVLGEDPFLFARTVRENLLLGAVASGVAVDDAALRAALVCAAADEIVDELPDGLDTVLSDRGFNLSGGQRQRLGLARALVAPPRVLVLDDALSAVNPSLELELLQRMRAHAPEMAILAITRRAEPTAIADRVHELEDRGLQRPPLPGGIFANLADLPTDAVLAQLVSEVPDDGDRPEISDLEATRSEDPPTVRNILRPLRGRVALLCAALLAFTAVSLVPQGLLKLVIDDFRRHEHAVSDRIALVLVVLAVAIGITKYFFSIFTVKVTEGIMYLLRRRTFQRLSRLGIDYYDRETPGQVAAKVVYDLDRISEFLEKGLGQVAVALFLLVVASAVVVVWNASVALAVAVFLPALIILTLVQLPIADRAFRRQRAALEGVVQRMEEDLHGRHTIFAFGARRHAGQAFAQSTWELRQARRWSAAVSNSYTEIVQFVLAISTAVLLAKAGNLALTGALSIGSVVALQFYLRAALAPIPLLSAAIQTYMQSRASFHTLRQPYLAPILPVEAADAREAPAFDGHIELEDVSFSYPHTGRQVLHRVGLDVAPGTQLALVGRTGAGKSSIAKLLARIYDPDEGRVLVDGVDLRTLRIEDYRRRLGIVPQDGFCFRGSVAENIAYGRPDASREELEEAARKVGAFEAIMSIPGGFDGRVQEEARNLTAAQRQLIALTRVMLVDPDVLILDEATACLDEALEETVLDALHRLGRTVVFVTHRLSVVKRADLVAVVDGGRIAEVGTHRQLLGQEGLYSEIWVRGIDGPKQVANGARNKAPARKAATKKAAAETAAGKKAPAKKAAAKKVAAKKAGVRKAAAK